LTKNNGQVTGNGRAGATAGQGQDSEHVFGTIKRTMNGGYFLLRIKRKVKCEASLLFLGYNLKRTVNVLGFRETMKCLDEYAERIGWGAANAISSFISGVLSGIFEAAFAQRPNSLTECPDF
jgi:hypothetical protein